MQISAANLLVAAGQPRSANAAVRPGAAFARALNDSAARPATTAFAPLDFEAEAAAQRPGEGSAAAVRPQPATGYGSAPAPGSQLDIRV